MLAKPKCEDLVIGSLEAEDFLEEIKAQAYTGYLKIEAGDLEFILFFENGTPSYGFRRVESQLFSFSNLAQVLDSLKDATIRFFETEPGVLQALLDKKFGKKIYGDLYTSFTNASKLMDMLKKAHHTGSVELDLSSIHCFILIEQGAPCEILCCSESECEGREESKSDIKNDITLEYVVRKAASQNGVIRVYQRRNPPTVLCPDLEDVFMWSDPRRLKLEFAFGQLGKEFEELLDQNMTMAQILNALYVDFEEIVDMYTYLSAKGYCITKKEY